MKEAQTERKTVPITDRSMAEFRLNNTPSEKVMAITSTAKSGVKRTAPKGGPALSRSEFLLLKRPKGDLILEVDGKRVSLTSLDRVYWPQEKLTKFDLLCYYLTIDALIVPFLKDRPAILQRWPRGINAPMFFQQDLESAPDFIKTVHLTNQ